MKPMYFGLRECYENLQFINWLLLLFTFDVKGSHFDVKSILMLTFEFEKCMAVPTVLIGPLIG